MILMCANTDWWMFGATIVNSIGLIIVTIVIAKNQRQIQERLKRQDAFKTYKELYGVLIDIDLLCDKIAKYIYIAPFLNLNNEISDLFGIKSLSQKRKQLVFMLGQKKAELSLYKELESYKKIDFLLTDTARRIIDYERNFQRRIIENELTENELKYLFQKISQLGPQYSISTNDGTAKDSTKSVITQITEHIKKVYKIDSLSDEQQISQIAEVWSFFRDDAKLLEQYLTELQNGQDEIKKIIVDIEAEVKDKERTSE